MKSDFIEIELAGVWCSTGVDNNLTVNIIYLLVAVIGRGPKMPAVVGQRVVKWVGRVWIFKNSFRTGPTAVVVLRVKNRRGVNGSVGPKTDEVGLSGFDPSTDGEIRR